ncbi:hypothetical protein QOZ80_8AG0629070 [Eleusine coracana subsp. coracana]|nr:hypothetical protein QOZ80_8AG0629070 [Eleusine coracana subsp. coracana]
MESWWPLSGWLSPGAAMFVFFNVLIGAVVVLSRGQQGGHGRRLCRSASSMVLGRLRSFSSMFSVHPAAEFYDYHHTSPEPEEQQEVGEVAVAPEPPSALAAAEAVPSAKEIETNKPEKKCTTCLDASNVQAEPSPSPASAVGEADTTALVVEEEERKEPMAKEAPAESSGNRRRTRVCRREAEEALAEGKAELNARAERFIHQFKEELKLQRLNSIINYTCALRHRAGAALLPQD